MTVNAIEELKVLFPKPLEVFVEGKKEPYKLLPTAARNSADYLEFCDKYPSQVRNFDMGAPNEVPQDIAVQSLGSEINMIINVHDKMVEVTNSNVNKLTAEIDRYLELNLEISEIEWLLESPYENYAENGFESPDAVRLVGCEAYCLEHNLPVTIGDTKVNAIDVAKESLASKKRSLALSRKPEQLEEERTNLLKEFAHSLNAAMIQLSPLLEKHKTLQEAAVVPIKHREMHEDMINLLHSVHGIDKEELEDLYAADLIDLVNATIQVNTDFLESRKAKRQTAIAAKIPQEPSPEKKPTEEKSNG